MPVKIAPELRAALVLGFVSLNLSACPAIPLVVTELGLIAGAGAVSGVTGVFTDENSQVIAVCCTLQCLRDPGVTADQIKASLLEGLEAGLKLTADQKKKFDKSITLEKYHAECGNTARVEFVVYEFKQPHGSTSGQNPWQPVGPGLYLSTEDLDAQGKLQPRANSLFSAYIVEFARMVLLGMDVNLKVRVPACPSDYGPPPARCEDPVLQHSETNSASVNREMLSTPPAYGPCEVCTPAPDVDYEIKFDPTELAQKLMGK